LDAYSCAMHDDCVSQFEVTYGPTDAIQSRYFAACAPEPITGGSCLATTCGPGTHCEEQCTGACPPDAGGMPCDVYCAPTCVPDPTYSCANVDCGAGYMCVEQCDPLTATPTMGGTGGIGCWPSCVQIVNDPGECYGAVACDALPPACPADTTAGVLNGCWSGYCIPTSQCGPQDPGTCDAATCATPPPSCPSGTTAGVKNGCYTGYCIPDSSCPQLPCEALTDEASCQARMECSAVYSGDNCTCLPDGTCTCTSQTFARCETWVL
ncbi:MAG: hypothetical protein NT062_08995, partial [Proteobacteria bacterium]|nr:hypothetical protein [Pseudomonadota bacterium]